MPQDSLFTFLLFPGFLAAIGAFFVSLADWRRGLVLLIVIVLFGGIVAARFANGAVAVLIRDLFIVLPLYVGFFARRAGNRALTRVPLEIAFCLVVLFVYVLISLLNPVDVSALTTLIGLKVLLFYIPFIVVGIALGGDRSALLSIFRAFLYLGLVPCAIGIVQSILVRLLGYQDAIQLFFGRAAESATQDFAYFDIAGGIYRIPSTFTFVAQYVGFLYLYLAVCMIEATADPDRRAKKVASVAIWLTLFAGIMSGARGALVFLPAMMLGFAVFGLMRRQMLIVAPIAVAVAIWGFTSLDVNLEKSFEFSSDLAVDYGFGVLPQMIADGLDHGGAFGAGIGTSTTAARYANPGFVDIGGALFGVESAYAKMAAELGGIGLSLFVMLILVIFLKICMVAWRNRRRETNPIVGSLTVYLLLILVSTYKGPVLDIDPSNIFFWLLLGVIIGIDRGDNIAPSAISTDRLIRARAAE